MATTELDSEGELHTTPKNLIGAFPPLLGHYIICTTRALAESRIIL
jgi:hypothetical protein